MGTDDGSVRTSWSPTADGGNYTYGATFEYMFLSSPVTSVTLKIRNNNGAVIPTSGSW